MASFDIDVSLSEEDSARIPDKFVRGALSLAGLRRGGTLAEVAELVRIQRSGGFCGVDVWVGLWLYFSSGSKTGLKRYWDGMRPHSAQVGALAGRTKLASPASLSRALSAVEPELLRPVGDPLLLAPADWQKVLTHPAMQTYDALGDAHHVFDLDPTVTTLRHRALPSSDELPECRRTSETTGAPGYKGRKRGDIVFRRVTVQHAGSGLWTHAHLAPGNGDAATDFGLALDSIVATATAIGCPLDRVVVRMDGEHGNVPWFAACRARHLPFVTRLNRSRLYDDPDVLQRLREATFHLVEDSGCGPQRAATDLGILTLHPAAKTRKPDGSKYAPVRVRVIACVFPKRGKAKRGRTIDGWEVELFAIDLPADRWPAAEAITAYYARNAEENRFAQDDRELGLDRILSYHLPGQELATLVGLSLWNHDLVRGFEQQPPPHERPVQLRRQRPVDHRIPNDWPRDPVLVKALGRLPWDALLVGPRAGWRFEPSTGEVVCPDDRRLVLTTVRKDRGGLRTGIIFRRPKGGCEDCASRPDCLKSERAGASKHAEFSVDTELASTLRARLARTRGKSDAAGLGLEPIEATPGPLAVRDSLFLPARARQLYRQLFDGATLHVDLHVPRAVPALTLVAADTADRQRRRRTWKQNIARYALPDGARVGLRLACREPLRAWMGEEERREVVLAG